MPMNALEFMQRVTNWLNTFTSVVREDPKAVVSLDEIPIIAFYQVHDSEGNPTHQEAYDVAGIETLPGGRSMVIRLAAPPEPAAPVPPELDAEEAQ